MSNSERFDRLTALLREAGLKQDRITAEIRLTHAEILAQNGALKQIYSTLRRSLADVASAKSELSYSLAEAERRIEILAAENREKTQITSILDLLTKP